MNTITLTYEELQALVELVHQCETASSFEVRKEIRSLSDTVDYVQLHVDVFGYACGTSYVWRNNAKQWIKAT